MTDDRDPELDALDTRWCAVEDARALGEEPEHAPPGDDPRWDPAWGRERAFYAALAQQATGVTAGEATAEDLALVEAVLARHDSDADAEHAAAEADAAPRRGVVVRWAVLALAVAAAVVLGWVALSPALGLRGSEGAWIAEEDQRRHGVGDALPMAVWLVAEDRACAALDDAALCAGQGTVVRMHPGDGRGVRVEVRHGAVTIDGALAVDTPAGQLRGDATSRYAVQVPEGPGAIEIQVERGSLELQQDDGTRRLDAGEHLRLEPDATEPTPGPAVPAVEEPSPVPIDEPSPGAGRSAAKGSDPATLLLQARAQLGEGDERGAAKAYAALLEAHPGSAEAQAARMSLGRLRLGAGRPKAALALFERYLQRGGPLAEEALWGKIQALDALGRPPKAKALSTAIDQLVREFPNSVYRERAQALLSP
jgi:Tetratricopeptide repeat